MNRVREFRRRRKWTQAELAKRTGIPQSEISKIENECGAVLLRHAKRISDVFGVKPQAVFLDGVREPDYYCWHVPRRVGKFAPWTDPDAHLCHWCGAPYDPARNDPVRVRIRGRERVYAHRKCRQEHIDTERYA